MEKKKRKSLMLPLTRHFGKQKRKGYFSSTFIDNHVPASLVSFRGEIAFSTVCKRVQLFGGHPSCFLYIGGILVVPQWHYTSQSVFIQTHTHAHTHTLTCKRTYFEAMACTVKGYTRCVSCNTAFIGRPREKRGWISTFLSSQYESPSFPGLPCTVSVCARVRVRVFVRVINIGSSSFISVNAQI